MKRKIMAQAAVGALAPFCIVISPGVFAQCSAEDISAYVQSGASADQLRQLCGQQNQQFNQPAYPNMPAATVCATQWGACPMAVLLPSGSACTCYTRVGPVPGIAR